MTARSSVEHEFLGRPHHHHETAFGGPVMIDIGGDRGALVVVAEPDNLGDECFLRRAGEPATETHVGIWERIVPAGAVVAAVFGSLDAGRYEIVDGHGGPVVIEAEVCGGDVTEVRLGVVLRTSGGHQPHG